MISLRLPSSDDAAELVEALLAAAEAREDRTPVLAARWRGIADQIGDALDVLPTPTDWEEPWPASTHTSSAWATSSSVPTAPDGSTGRY